MRTQLSKIVRAAFVRPLLAAGFGLAMAFGLTLSSCGPSAAEIAIRSAPSVEAVKGLKDKLIWLQGNAQSGGNYILEIDADEKDLNCGGFLSSCTEIFYKNKSNITITLRGIGENWTINNGFTVGSGVTLILDDNIMLKGKTKGSALVMVSSGGTLVMNDGSTITGAINNRNDVINTKTYGAGVYVSDGATFLMKGGTISGNTIRPRQPDAQEIAVAIRGAEMRQSIGGVDTKSGLGKISCGGSGVYVSGEGIVLSATFSNKPNPSGTFIKTGGTITGYSSDPENGNAVRDIEGNAMNGFGHAVLFSGKEPKAIDTTVGPEYSFNFSNGTFSEIQNEKPKPRETIAEPEETTVQSDE